ncbi:DUF6362 family protein [Pseudogemmobacter sp. W21_MBD1_M6]|uniref:DUF6362 family protein n=1 Tax=Pseudogemmobacter sp. W21_MBD1_M6 TaxID=3240271 RepID=UPI003F96975A
MDEWTRGAVADRLELAADVMASLPAVRPQGYISTWPEYSYSFADQVGQEPRMRRPLPSPRMISEADEAMLWLRWLEKDIGEILWARANRKAWKGICWTHGVSRKTATKRHLFGLSVIVWRLNGLTYNPKRSMDYTIGRVR